MTDPGQFDRQWHEAALRGNPSAIAKVVQESLPVLFRFCLFRLRRDRSLCEEVVQDTFLKAIRSLDRYEPERANGEILPWLCGLARNEIRRTLAQRRETQEYERLWSAMDADLRQISELGSARLADETMQRESARELVNAAMSQLPVGYQLVLEAKYLSCESVRQMAVRFSLTEKAVESRLSRARQAFRETFLALVNNLQEADRAHGPT